MKNKIIAGFQFFLVLFVLLYHYSCHQDKINEKEISNDVRENQLENEKVHSALMATYKKEKRTDHYFQFVENKKWIDLTFQDVLPIIQSYCMPCHHKGGNAPFSLTSYNSIKKRSKAIEEALLKNIMPPWRADRNYNQYQNSPDLPDSLRTKLIQWIKSGSMINEKLDVFPTTYSMKSKPDLNLEATDTYTLSSNKDDYVCHIIDPKFEEETFVRAFTFSSTNISMVHHYTLFVDTTGEVLSDKKTWSCKTDPITLNLQLIDTWAKGIRFIEYAKGLAYRFPKKSKFLLQTHYAGYGNKGKSESCVMSLYTIKSKPSYEVNWMVLNKTDIHIPANTVKTEESKLVLDKAITLLGVVPHMHYLGKKMEIFAIKPNGEKERIVYIPDWSYVVQNKYMLKKPIALPEGSIIYTCVLYDNTNDNPEQPNHPIRDVVYNQSSYDEMLAVGYYYLNGFVDNHFPDTSVIFIP